MSLSPTEPFSNLLLGTLIDGEAADEEVFILKSSESGTGED